MSKITAHDLLAAFEDVHVETPIEERGHFHADRGPVGDFVGETAGLSGEINLDEIASRLGQDDIDGAKLAGAFLAYGTHTPTDEIDVSNPANATLTFDSADFGAIADLLHAERLKDDAFGPGDLPTIYLIVAGDEYYPLMDNVYAVRTTPGSAETVADQLRSLRCKITGTPIHDFVHVVKKTVDGIVEPPVQP